MPHRRTATLVAATSLVLPSLLVGCVAPSNPSSPVASASPSPTTSSASPSPIGSAVPSGPAPSVAVPSATPATAGTFGPWHAAADAQEIAGVQFGHVVWTGTRFVATATALAGSGVFEDSTDGATWHLQPSSDPDASPDILAAGPNGVVAIGRVGESLASWFSPDGLTWRVHESAFQVTVGGDDVSVTDVIATDGGWLAVGRADPPCNIECGLTPVRALAWRSTDGLHWSRVPDQASFAKAGMTGVAPFGGGFVAVGLSGDHAAAWTSPDGVSWTGIPDAPMFHELPSADPSGSTQMAGIAAGHGVVVAVGYEGPGGAHGPAGRAWWTADGSTWETADGEGFEPTGELSVLLSTVIATPDGFLAVSGQRGSCASGMWATPDGRAWACAAATPGMDGLTTYAAASSGSTEVLVGLDGSGEPGDAGYPGAVWLRSIR